MKNNDARIFTAPLLSVSADMTDLCQKTRNAWMYNFLELFKGIINTFPAPEECAALLSNPDKKNEFYRKYVIPLMKKIEELKNEKRDNLVELGDIDSRVQSGLENPVTFDLLQDRQYERIANPTMSDMVPDICISEKTFMESGIANVGIGFPYDKIPVMCIIPSVSSVYEKNDNLSKLYYKVNHNDCLETPTLEISIRSLLEDWKKLYPELTTEGNERGVSEYGMCLLREIVEKYTDFVLPLIMLNLRKDYEYGNSLVEEIYNYFANNYQSALVANKYMYGITNALIYSKLGRGLVQAWAFKYSTSVLDLIDPNFKYVSLLREQFDEFSSGNVSAYMNYIQRSGLDFTPFIEPANEERDALARLIVKVTNTILQIFSNSISVNGEYIVHAKLNQVLATMLGPLDKARANGDFTWCYINDCLASILDEISKGGIRNLIKTVAQVQMIKTTSNAEGAMANKNQFTPIAQQVLSGKNLQITNYVGNSSAALECADLIREIINTGSSNAVMRMIATECENLQTFEQAKAIMMEADMFEEVLEKTTIVKHESAAHVEFKRFLSNTKKQVSQWQNELKPF